MRCRQNWKKPAAGYARKQCCRSVLYSTEAISRGDESGEYSLGSAACEWFKCMPETTLMKAT